MFAVVSPQFLVLTAKIIYYLCQYMFMKYKILKFGNLFGGKKYNILQIGQSLILFYMMQ